MNKMHCKYSPVKEYDEYVDYLYLKALDRLIHRYQIRIEHISDNLLHELKDKAKNISKTTSFTMIQSVEEVFKPLRATKNR